MSDQVPLFGCNCCASEVSYPASDLVVTPDGTVWHSECLYNEDGDVDCAPYVPAHEKRIAALQSELDRIRPAAQAVVKWYTRFDEACPEIENLAAALEATP